MTGVMRLGTGILALAIVAWGVRTLFPSEEQKIRRHLEELADTASTKPGESNLGRMARAARIGRYFTEDVVVDLDERFRVIRGRDAVVGAAAQIPVASEEVTYTFVDIQVAVSPEAQTATVRLTVQGSGVDVRTGDDVIDALELVMMFHRIEDQWLIARVDGVDTIHRPGAGRPSSRLYRGRPEDVSELPTQGTSSDLIIGCRLDRFHGAF